MDKSWMKIVHRTKDPRYKLGVEDFLNFAYRNKEDSSKIPCPCKSCNNFRLHDKYTVYHHLMQRGICWDYDRWIYHGESHDGTSDDEDSVFDDGEGNDDGSGDDELDDMIHNLGQSHWGENWHDYGESSNNSASSAETLRRLLDEARQELYPGCEHYSKLSFVVTLLHLKTISGWTSKSFDSLLDVFKKALPNSASVPKNFYEAKKVIRELGFQCEKIHACVNDCVLFRNEYAFLETCPNNSCKESRYSGEGSIIPRKVLRYFLLKPKLQKLFLNEEMTRDMRWHKEKRVDDDNIIRHPANSEAWKHLDRVFPSFSNDPRSVRLGLATDGFNPFGNLSNAYSVWPVFLVPYNLPP